MANYKRVLPRDLFNEASLLKCIGRLCLLIHDDKLPGWTFEYDGEPFDIRQVDSDGDLLVENISFYHNRELRIFVRPLNSRQPWPLIDSFTMERVFDHDGIFILQ